MLEILPLTIEHWQDLESLFSQRGCSEARRCWCMYYRMSGSEWNALGAELRQETHDRLQALASVGRPPGLIGYVTDGSGHRTPMGWVSLAPRTEFRRLERSRVMKAVDAQPVWSIICFVVPSEYRGQGVAHELLQGAIQYAREQGAEILEAYPVDRAANSKTQASWFGSATMYAAAGFQEVARHREDRPVMRLFL